MEDITLKMTKSERRENEVEKIKTKHWKPIGLL